MNSYLQRRLSIGTDRAWMFPDGQESKQILHTTVRQTHDNSINAGTITRGQATARCESSCFIERRLRYAPQLPHVRQDYLRRAVVLPTAPRRRAHCVLLPLLRHTLFRSSEQPSERIQQQYSAEGVSREQLRGQSGLLNWETDGGELCLAYC